MVLSSILGLIHQLPAAPFPSCDNKNVSMNAHLCLTVCDPIDCSPPGSSVHGIFQATIQEWIAMSYS